MASIASLRAPTPFARAQVAPTRRATTVCALPQPDALKKAGAALCGGLLAASSLMAVPSAMAAAQIPTPSSITGEKMGVPNARERLGDADVEDVRSAVEQQGGELQENVKANKDKLVDTVKAVKAKVQDGASNIKDKVNDISMAPAPVTGDLALFGFGSNKVGGEANRAVNNPQGKAQGDLNRIKNEAKSNLNEAADRGADLARGIKNAPANATGKGNNLVDTVKGNVKDAANSVKGNNLVDNVKSNVKDAANSVKGNNLVDTVKGNVKDAASNVKDAVKGISMAPAPVTGDLALFGFGNKAGVGGEANRAVNNPQGKAKGDLNRIKDEAKSNLNEAADKGAELAKGIKNAPGKAADKLKRDAERTIEGVKTPGA